jgi:hypothetical protein
MRRLPVPTVQPPRIRSLEAEEREFVRRLADYVIARADGLEAMAAEIPKFGADNFG